MLACVYYVLPELALGLTALAVIVFDWFLTPKNSGRVGFVALLGATAALVTALWTVEDHGDSSLFFRDMLVHDQIATTMRFFFIAAAIVAFVFSMRSRSLEGVRMGEFYASILTATMGMTLLAASADWLMFLIALETVSLPSYVLAGYLRNERPSVEASLKYVLYGSVASAVMLFGISYFYGLSGTTAIAGSYAGASEANGHIYAVAIILLLAGLLFKISAVPFQFWAPDVYEGAPTPITAWLSVASKAAGFAALLRAFSPIISGEMTDGLREVVDFIRLPWLFWALSAATMTYGNLAAIKQNNIKRLLAYSSIAHAGYLLMAFSVIGQPGMADAVSVMLFYLFIYFIMNFGAFYCVQVLENKTGRSDIGVFRGLMALDSKASISPSFVIAMVLCLVSLTGLPVLAGFIAKFQLFGVLIEQSTQMHFALAVVGILNSVVSLYYYFRVIKAMTFEKADEDVVGHYRIPLFDSAALWVFSAALLYFFFAWDGLQNVAEMSRMLVAGF